MRRLALCVCAMYTRTRILLKQNLKSACKPPRKPAWVLLAGHHRKGQMGCVLMLFGSHGKILKPKIKA